MIESSKYIGGVESAIRLYMRSNGLVEQDLADRLGISQSAVNNVLKRGTDIYIDYDSKDIDDANRKIIDKIFS